MRSDLLLVWVILGMAFSFSSCGNSESDRVRDEARQTLPAPPPNSAVATPAVPTFSAQPHYKCPNNCSGGIGDTAGSCPVCGTQMAHNQAYHDQASTTPTLTPPTGNTPPTPTPSPAQNAAGVYHYTCSNGCAGGGGSPVACATCGSTLAHNPAYHGN